VEGIIGRQRTSRLMEAAGREGPLLDAIRTLCETGDRDTAFSMQTRTREECLRMTKVLMILFNE
jgi:hypothetical protein